MACLALFKDPLYADCRDWESNHPLLDDCRPGLQPPNLKDIKCWMSQSFPHLDGKKNLIVLFRKPGTRKCAPCLSEE